MKPNSRKIASQILLSVLQQGKSLPVALQNHISKAQQDDKPLIQAICYGVLRHYDSLKAVVDQLMSKPLKPKDQDIELLLLIGAHQIFNMRIPEHAAVKETTSAAKSTHKPWAGNLINGVLRNLIRQQEQLIKQIDSIAKLSHPAWLVAMLEDAYPDSWQTICYQANLAPPMHLRVNTQKIGRTYYVDLLRQHNIDAEVNVFSTVGVTLSTPHSINDLPHFNEGWVSVQDVAAQQAVTLIDPQPGERILDACAAPGGKTGHILEACPQADLFTLDHDKNRLEKVKENLARLGVSATLQCGDATQKQWWDKKLFDRILIDAPCSGTGVIRRHPDIKFLRHPEDITRLAETQLAMLNNLWPMLQPGGLLLYATCSILPQENDMVVKQFHAEATNAKVLKTWQILPQHNGPDGFYYCQIQKKM